MASVLPWGWWQVGMPARRMPARPAVPTVPVPRGPQIQGHRARDWQWAGDSHSSSRQTGRVEGRMRVGRSETNNKNKIPVSTLEFV